MGLEKALGWMNAATCDPVLVIMVNASAVHLYQERPYDINQCIMMLGLTSAFIVGKNLYDYYRVGKHITENGWTPALFTEPYGWQVSNWAEANGQKQELQACRATRLV